MRIIPAIFFVLSIGLMSVDAYESGQPPDYKAIFKDANLVIEGKVAKVVFPRKLSRPTEVTLQVTKVLKGDLKAGDSISVFHESSTYISKNLFGRSTVMYGGKTCPAPPSFKTGEKVKIYAEWDPANKRYVVPGHWWKVSLSK